MSKNSPLLSLINELTPSEKSYFKKNLFQFTGGKELNYKKAFDQVIRYERDDNEFLGQIISSGQISRIKSYLYEQLLLSLESYTVNSDESLQNKRSLNYCRILFQKGLITQAKTQVEKTIRMAESTFNYYTQLEALALKRKILMTELNLTEIEAVIQEEERITMIIGQIRDLEKIYVQIAVNTFTKGNNLNETEMKDFQVRFRYLEIWKTNDFNSVIALSIYFRIMAIYFMSIKNLEASYDFAYRRLELMEANAGYCDLDQQNYINTLNNVIDVAILTSRVDEAEKLNDKLKLIKPKSPFYLQRRDIRYCITRLQIDIFKGTVKGLSGTLEAAKTILLEENRLLRKDERVELYFLLSALLFNHSKFKEAKTEIVRFLQEPVIDIRIDSQCYMRLMLIYIYFKQGEFEFLQNQINNTHRFLKNKNFLNSTEKTLLEFIKSQINSGLKKNFFLKQINFYKEKLDTIISDQGNVSFGKYINFR